MDVLADELPDRRQARGERRRPTDPTTSVDTRQPELGQTTDRPLPRPRGPPLGCVAQHNDWGVDTAAGLHVRRAQRARLLANAPL
jgi:hypothetical protein